MPASVRAPVQLRGHRDVLDRDAERHEDAQAGRVGASGRSRRRARRRRGVAGEVALLAVEAVLGDVVDHERRGALEEVLGEHRVEVDRARHRCAGQVRAAERALRIAHDRRGRDDHVRAARGLLAAEATRRRAPDAPRPAPRRARGGGRRAARGGERGRPRSPARDATWPWRPQPTMPDRLDGALRQRADAEHAGGGSADLGDPGRVHHGERAPGGRV